MATEVQSTYTVLSDMLDKILSESYTKSFSEDQDELLSKIQSQALKLRSIFLNQMKKAQGERAEIQSLISDIAHQLKTPLTNVRIYGDLLKLEDISKEERENFIQSFYQQIEKLSFLTENLIKMSRLESGVIQINPTACSLNETVMKAVKQVYQKALHKNIVLQLKKDTPINLHHDSNWITEAIFNLLDNAIKYTPTKGTVTIQIHSYELFARVDIADTGIGIPKDEVTKIYHRFFRGKNADQTDGIGLGLYLTRKIIYLHGGYMKLHTSSTGSIFSVFLPLS